MNNEMKTIYKNEEDARIAANKFFELLDHDCKRLSRVDKYEEFSYIYVQIDRIVAAIFHYKKEMPWPKTPTIFYIGKNKEVLKSKKYVAVSTPREGEFYDGEAVSPCNTFETPFYERAVFETEEEKAELPDKDFMLNNIFKWLIGNEMDTKLLCDGDVYGECCDCSVENGSVRGSCNTEQLKRLTEIANGEKSK